MDIDSAVEPSPTPPPPAPSAAAALLPAPPPPGSARQGWFRRHRRTLISVTVAAAAGLTIGLVVNAITYTNASSTIEAYATSLDSATERAEKAEYERDRLQDAASSVARREHDVSAREAEVDERDAAVTAREQLILKNSIDGDGVYIVNREVEPGQYRSEGGSGCYWARLNAAGDDIIDNHFGNGPAIVTIQPSDGLIEVSGCASFIKVG